MPDAQLLNVTVKTLQQWNADPLCRVKEFDRRFVRLLLTDVFGTQTLKKSSVFGNKSSAGTVNDKLDESKLNFIRQIFKLRVGDDLNRASTLNSIINCHCNNLRKQNPAWA